MTQSTTTQPVADLNARTTELDRGHVFHSWMAQSAQGGLLPIAGGRGTTVWDHAGKEYSTRALV